MTVAELLSRISSSELAEWQAFASIEPFGEFRADIRAAMIATTTANTWKGKGQRPSKITDFMLSFEPPREQTPEEIIMIFQAAAAAANKKKVKKNGNNVKSST